MSKQKENTSLSFRRNLLVAGAVAVLLLLLYLVPGYNRVVIGARMSSEEIDDYEKRTQNNNLPKLTTDAKRFFKIPNYWYLKYLRENTPENAVILLPPSAAVDTSSEMKFMSHSDWVEYFIYPRLCVSEDEKMSKPELYAKANYVAIVFGWGYDKLHYVPAKYEPEIVLPIDSVKK